MNNLTLLLLFIVLFILVGWVVQAARLFPEYKNSPLGELFGGFLGYFWHAAIRQDASESFTLRREIGTSRLLYSKVDAKGHTVARICTVFYSRGIMVLAYLITEGTYRGRAKDGEWIVTRQEKKETSSRRIINPTPYIQSYLLRLAKMYPDVHLETRLCFPDRADFSQLKSDIRCVHVGDVLSELKNVSAPSMSDQEILDCVAKTVEGKPQK